MAAPMLEFRTSGYNPYAVKYSPYIDSRIAVAASANFGIVGNGRVYCLTLAPDGAIIVDASFDTNDALYDLAWSEINERQLVVACGDGSIKLFDAAVGEFPVMNFHEHKREAYSVAWSPITKDAFASSSWDGTVKIVSPFFLFSFSFLLVLLYLFSCLQTPNKTCPLLPQWSPARSHSLKTLPVGNCVYSTSFCPTNPAIISAVSSDSHIRIFDLRTPASAKYHLTTVIPVHGHASPSTATASAPPSEVLTHDWNKYRDGVVATGGVDGVLRTFDVRNPNAGPLAVMQGHRYAVRRLAWSPHSADVLLSGSYDMTVRLWNDASGAGGTGAGVELGVMNRHTEFVTGVDWCLFGTGGWVATAGWDERVLLWDANVLAGGSM